MHKKYIIGAILGGMMMVTNMVSAASFMKDSNQQPIVHWAVVEAMLLSGTLI